MASGDEQSLAGKQRSNQCQLPQRIQASIESNVELREGQAVDPILAVDTLVDQSYTLLPHYNQVSDRDLKDYIDHSHDPPLIQAQESQPQGQAYQTTNQTSNHSLSVPRTQAIRAEKQSPRTALSSFNPRCLLAAPEPDTSLQILLQALSTSPIPPARPNLHLGQQLFDKNDTPACSPLFHYKAWEALLKDYPDWSTVEQVLGAIKHGVVLGYSGKWTTEARISTKNLPMSFEDKEHIRSEIADRLKIGRLQEVQDPAECKLVCSPIGTVPKPGSSKLRTIHHLSHPRLGDSINSGIDNEDAAIHYESLETICAFVAQHAGALLWKADLREAFRSVIIGSKQSRLLGFSFEGKCYMERALSFGGRSSPKLFNIFAELLHWLLHRLLSNTNQSAPSHYLDDFFGASTAGSDPYMPIWYFQLLCSALGFTVSPEKVFWGTTKLTILGIEIDTITQRASISAEKKEKLLKLCRGVVSKKKATLLEMQQVAGHLQFVVQIAPHGKAFMRRLYDGVRCRYKHPFQHMPISKEVRRELEWWCATIEGWNGTTLRQPSPLLLCHIWTDACPRGLGAHMGLAELPSKLFKREVSRRHRNKSIHFLETLAALEALRCFTVGIVPGTMVVLHVDNEILRAGLLKGSVDDPLTQVLLREIFALSLARDFKVTSQRVSSEENNLADALSRNNLTTISQEFPKAYLLLTCMLPEEVSTSAQASQCRKTLPSR